MSPAQRLQVTIVSLELRPEDFSVTSARIDRIMGRCSGYPPCCVEARLVLRRRVTKTGKPHRCDAVIFPDGRAYVPCAACLAAGKLILPINCEEVTGNTECRCCPGYDPADTRATMRSFLKKVRQRSSGDKMLRTRKRNLVGSSSPRTSRPAPRRGRLS